MPAREVCTVTENGGASAFEELYGITEEEFNAMSPEELDAFMKEHYNN